jgi:hypothetical protein
MAAANGACKFVRIKSAQMNTMNPTVKTPAATSTGILFITATVTAIAGLALYDPLLNHADYLERGAGNANRIVLGAIFELIAAATVAGTGIMLYPWLRTHNERLGLGYICFRLLETVFILIGILSVLALLALSRSYTHAADPDEAVFETGGATLKAIRDLTFILGPNFLLGINTFIYSYVFYRSGLVPRKLSVFGLTAASLIFVAALLELFGIFRQVSVPGAVLSFPIFVFELVLAARLIRKGMSGQPVERR